MRSIELFWRGMLPEIAPVGLRVAGGIIDFILSVVLLLLFSWLSGLGTVFEDETQSGIMISGIPLLVGCLFVILVFATMEAALGWTPGKFLFGTRVTDRQGGRIGIVAALARNLLRFVDGIAFYLVGTIIARIDRQNRRLGDIVARTLVVRDE